MTFSCSSSKVGGGTDCGGDESFAPATATPSCFTAGPCSDGIDCVRSSPRFINSVMTSKFDDDDDGTLKLGEFLLDLSTAQWQVGVDADGKALMREKRGFKIRVRRLTWIFCPHNLSLFLWMNYV